MSHYLKPIMELFYIKNNEWLFKNQNWILEQKKNSPNNDSLFIANNGIILVLKLQVIF